MRDGSVLAEWRVAKMHTGSGRVEATSRQPKSLAVLLLILIVPEVSMRSRVSFFRAVGSSTKVNKHAPLGAKDGEKAN